MPFDSLPDASHPPLHSPALGRLRRWLAQTLLALGVAALAACGGNSAPPPTPPAAASAVIGSAGGTLTGPDGVQVVIPPGALTADTTIGIARSGAGAPAALPDQPIAGSPYEFTPHNLVFNLPVTIRMPLPPGSDGSALFMASPGEDWEAIEATVTAGVAEWQRNSFSWGAAGLACVTSGSSTDIYPCVFPSGGAQATATPAGAITHTGFGTQSLYGGNAGSWNVTQAATVAMTLNYSAAPDCANAKVKLIRWNPAVPVTASNPATIVFEQSVSLTPTVFTSNGPLACTGATNIEGLPCGSYRRGVGSTTVNVPFSHLDSTINATGTHAFRYSFSCSRPGKQPSGGGDLMTFKVAIPVPSVTYTVGGTVTGLIGSGLVLASAGLTNLPISVDGNFSFAPPVGPGTAYAVSVVSQPTGQTCTVANGAGTANANVTNVAVTCAATSAGKAWQGAATLDAGADQAYSPRVIFDANGNGMAIWTQNDGTFLRIKSRRYTPGGGWGAVMAVDNGSPANALSPKIVVDGAGNMTAIWLQPITVNTTSIWVNVFNPSTGWGTATLLENNLSSVGGNNPEIAMNAAGDATMVWMVFDGSWTNLWAKRLTAGAGWSAATLIENDNNGGAAGHGVVMDATGNATVVWHHYDSVGTRLNLMANRFVVGSGWGTPVPLESSNLDILGTPSIAVDGAGNVRVAWSQQSSAGSTIRNLYTSAFSGGSWSTPTLVKANIAYVDHAALAMNAAGQAMLVWVEDDGFDTTSTWAQPYAGNVGGAITRIDDQSQYTTGRQPRVAIDASGNAIALWGQHAHILSARYVAGTGWGAPTDIDSSAATTAANETQLAVDLNGNVLAVWARSGGVATDIWFNLFK